MLEQGESKAAQPPFLRPRAGSKLTQQARADDGMSPRRSKSGDPVNRSLSSRSLTAFLALALAMVTILALLAFSGQAMAHTPKAHAHKACSPSSVSHSKRGAHACAQSRHGSKPHKGKAHAHAKVKGHHAKHATKGKKVVKKAAKRKVKVPASAVKSPATCEDGSVPVLESDGYFSCDDESEPGCESGAIPMLSANGSKLICGIAPKGIAPKGIAPSAEAACEDGSTPSQSGEGSFSCDDESEPTCENGSEPTLSNDGTNLLCNVSTTEKKAG